MSFVLVLWDDPSSSSVVNKKDVLGGVVVGQKRFVKWHGKNLSARIIRTGELVFHNDHVLQSSVLWIF